MIHLSKNKLPPQLWTTLKILGLINILDITTSIPSEYNTATGQRGLLMWMIQLLLMIPTLFWVVRVAPSAKEWILKISRPIPKSACWVIGALLIAQLIMVMFKIERFPLTNVGMFTYAIKDWKNDVYLSHLYILPAGQQENVPVEHFEGQDFQVFSLRKTGDYWFSEEIFTDHEFALFLVKYRSKEAIRQQVTQLLAEQGMGPPLVVHAKVHYGPGRKVTFTQMKPYQTRAR